MSALADLYTIPQEHLDFRDTIRQIARERIAPRAAEIDEKAEYPHDLRQLLAEQDILGLPFETEYGGTGTGALMLNMAVEEIAKACASTALILMVQELGTLPIKLFGSEDLKARFLPRCASGEWSPAFALSEPDAGSDPGGMLTKAVPDGDEWVITGTKNWITNLGIADFYVVFAVTDTQAGRGSASASSSTNSGSGAPRPASRSSTTCAFQPSTWSGRSTRASRWRWRRSTARVSGWPRRRWGSPRAPRTTPQPTRVSAGS